MAKNLQRKSRYPAGRPDPLPDEAQGTPRRRKNAWDPQVMPPQKVDLPLRKEMEADVAVPTTLSGQSLLDPKR